MKILMCLLLFLSSTESYSQKAEYDSIQKELIRLFSNGSLREAGKLADFVLPLIENDPNRDDSIYACILYYASITYGLQNDYIKPVETTIELEKISLQRFGEKSMKYYGALYLKNEYYHRMGDQLAIINYNNKIKSVLSSLLAGADIIYPGFDMVYKKPDIKFCLSVCLNTLAFAHGGIGKISEADNYIAESLLLLDEEYLVTHDPRSYTNFLFNYAYFLNDIERLEEAEKTYIQAAEWAKKVYNETHPSYAETLLEQASFYTTTGDYEKSIKLLLQVKVILENSFQKKSSNYRRALINLANLYININNFTDAVIIINLLKKLILKNENDNTYYKASIILPQVRLQLLNNNFNSADSLLTMLESYQYIDSTLYSYILPAYNNSRAAYYSQKKEFEKAKPYFAWMVNNELQSGRKNTSGYSTALMKQANNYLNVSIPDSAELLITESAENITGLLKKNFSFFSDNQRQNYLEKSEYLFHSLYKITAVSKSDQLITTAYNSQLLLKGLLLKTSALRNRQIKWKNQEHKNLFFEYLDLRKAIIAQSGKSDATGNTLDKLKERSELLEKKISKFSENLIDQSFNTKTADDIGKSLKQGEAAIEFISYNSSDTGLLGALLITFEKKQPQFIRLCSQDQLANLLKNKSINPRATIDLLYSGVISNSLYHLIWSPLETHLENIKKIYFAPSGLLYQVSLAALQADNNELISDRYILSQVNSTSFIASPHNYTISPSDKIILYGGIIYNADSTTLKRTVNEYKHNISNTRSFPDDLERGGGFPFLPATEKEITQIMALGKSGKYKIQMRKGILASEESIKALDENTSPAILHIASHGFFFPNKNKKSKDILYENQRGSAFFKDSENPLFRAGLAFAGAETAWKGKAIDGIDDGILTAYEISNLDLHNSKLVVLSACETGLGDIKGNEGVFGLQRSFNMAGVENLVMSLWKVADTESAEFMTLFYKNIFAGLSIEDAFQNTQTFMKKKYRNEPYKWAAWIFVR